MTDTKIIERIFDVIVEDVSPLTLHGVQHGSKVFGGAVLRKSDLALVLAETNNQVASPLWHGEMWTINKFFELPSDQRPEPRDCIFITTHEPCSLCLSGITWSGFNNFYYFFTYEDSRDAFDTPYDIQILEAVYQVADPGKEVSPDRPLYNRKNKYFTAYSLKDVVKDMPAGEDKTRLEGKIKNINSIYENIEKVYQESDGKKGIFVSY